VLGPQRLRIELFGRDMIPGKLSAERLSAKVTYSRWVHLNWATLLIIAQSKLAIGQAEDLNAA
jgi:hypothetical protein